jgi:nitrogenase-associated protein
MAIITFYEKPGCAGNNRQKELLVRSGHSLVVLDLLSHPWNSKELRPFLGGKPANECFNAAAPDVRDGFINPSSFSDEEAMALMVANPLLIRRPLMVIEGRYFQGFDTALLQSVISLDPMPGAEKVVEKLMSLDLDSCAHPSTETCN